MKPLVIDKGEYLKNPCGTSSLPYWKAAAMTVPENMLIRHDRDFRGQAFADYNDEPYFRLFHDLKALPTAALPHGFCQCDAAPGEYAAHIDQCYPDTLITEAEIKAYSQHPIYAPELWIAVREYGSGKLAATGIAELDDQIGEGILEWIQVSPSYRRLGLGRYVVAELLNRISKKARFATVSGQVNNPSNPESLYRECGFRGNDVWHILTKQG